MSVGSARAATTPEDEHWQTMLAYDTLASAYGWTIEQIDNSPDEKIDDLVEVWNARARVEASKSRKAKADALAQSMTAKWRR